MSFLKRISQIFSRMTPSFGALSLTGLRTPAADEVLEIGEEIAAGLGLAAIACWASEFLPFWAGFIALGAGAWAVFSIDRDFFPVACRTAFGVFALFMAFSQPWVGLIGCFALAGWAAFDCYERFGKWISICATVSALVGSMGMYQLSAGLLLPFIHPLTVAAYNVGPLVAVVCGVLVSLYCAWRIKGDSYDRIFYKVAPAVCAALFALFFPMKNTWVGLGAEWVFVAAVLAVGLRGSRTMIMSGTAFGALFAGAFLLMNGSSVMHKMAMAESMQVTEVKRLPAAPPSRIMPIVVGRDFCVQGNDATMTETGEAHAVIMDGTFYWQCPTHYTGFQINHLFSWIPGSTAGFVMVNAGTTASDTRVNDHGFIFGETSNLVKAAFEARHPASTVSGFTYAPDSSGNYRLLVIYTTNQLFWGAMVPTSGVMSVTPWGFVEDYTVAEAARTFPGTFLYPADLARQYADAWAGYTIGKVISRNFLEVSEAPQAQGTAGNPFPYGIETAAGPKYFIPYEPQGKQGTAMSDVAFFDGSTGDNSVQILHLADSDQTGETNSLGHRSIQGPKELLEKSANVVQGHFQLTAIEPIIVVTKAGRIYFITANMGPDKTKSNHDYQGDTLSYETGEPQWVITSSADAQRLIDAHEKLLDDAAPAPQAVATPADKAASSPPVKAVGPAPASVNPAAISPNPAPISPNPAAISPNPAPISPNPAAISPNPTDASPK